MTFNEKLRESLRGYHLLQHPFYQDWMEGKLTLGDLQNYAKQYFPHVHSFSRYISATHSNCESLRARKILSENLCDEDGLSQTAHPELWQQFAQGVGVDIKDLNERPCSEASKKLIDNFLRSGQSSYAEGLCSLYAYEYQIPEIAKLKIEGLVKHFNLNDKKTLEFFQVHETADFYHRKACEELIDELPEEDQEKALLAAIRSGQSLWNFLSSLQEDGNKNAA